MADNNNYVPNQSFTRLSSYRQNHFVRSARSAFAEYGYHNTSMQDIAKATQLSVGTVYQYFPSKEALYLYIVDLGIEVLREIIKGMGNIEGSVEERIRGAIKFSLEKAKEHADYLRIYLDLSRQPQNEEIEKEIKNWEKISIDFYKKLLQDAIKEGIAREDLDIGMAAYTIDSTLLITMQAISYAMYNDRMKSYLGDNIDDIDHLVDRITKSILNCMQK